MPHDTPNLDREIMQTLLTHLARFPTKTAELSAQTDLAADINIDSVNMMELLMEVEDTFDVSFPLNMMANVNTVQDLADQIKQLVEKKP
ncbi:acyl carrier protein [Roseovarius sp. MBR-78]|jgi:acyl carrier protein|uniref:acyl carrier protein n=1 Tax=Roseovarius sp. MBR-78 TaxID=3156460 RepID=UPI003394AD85